MHLESSKERLWSRMIWPLLWPLMLVQATLIALCLMTGLILWWAAPAHASWGATFWLTLALLVGSCLTVTIFLTLLRQRLAIREAALVRLLEDHEKWLGDACRSVAETARQRPIPEDPLDRIARLLEGMRTLYMERLETGPLADDEERARLLDALEESERHRDRLATGRQWAQEESRLKSGFLMHLCRDLEPLMTSLARRFEALRKASAGDDAERAALRELHQRLSGTCLLLESLAGETLQAEAAGERRAARVLIVDDGPVNLRLAGQVLEREGIPVQTATSGRQALACLEREPFDLVLMDIVMPDLDGVETSRRWREIEASRGAGRRSVLVALTASVSLDDRHGFIEAGMDDFLVKPYRPQDLLKLVKRWLPAITMAAEPT